MDQWLNDAPALAHVKDLSSWVVVNNNWNVIAWTDDIAEAEWLSLWLLEYKKKAKPQMAIASNNGGRKLRPVARRQIGGRPVSPQIRSLI